jgi:hypothetical protein
MIEIIIGVTVFVVAMIFMIGGITRPGTSVTPPLGSTENCELACASLREAHRQVCEKQADIARFTSQRDADSIVLRNAQIAAALILAAAIAASLIPFIGNLLAGPLWAAYLTAQAYVVFVLGQVAGSAGGISNAENALRVANNVDRQGIDEVRRVCPEAEANRCIDGLQPC